MQLAPASVARTAAPAPAPRPKAPAKSHVVPVDGGDLLVRQSGDGPPALLLSGGPGIENYMDGVAELFAQDFSSIRYTQRGVAPSVASGPFTIDQHLEDAIAVLDQLKIPKAWLIGHSWGGYLALRMAQEYPDRVAGVISIDGLGMVGDGGYGELKANLSGRMTDDERITARLLQQNIIWNVGPRREAAYQEAVKRAWPLYFSSRKQAPEYEPLALSSVVAEHGTNHTQWELATGEPERKLSRVKVPTLFIHGAQDPLPASVAQATADQIPGSKVEIIAGAGHYPWYEKPKAVRDAFLGWKASLDGKAIAPAGADAPQAQPHGPTPGPAHEPYVDAPAAAAQPGAWLTPVLGAA